MEPAVKKAVEEHPEGRILAAATPLTCRGDKLRKLDRTDLVRQIERHERFAFRDFALLIHHPAI